MTESQRKRRIEKRKETLFKQAKELCVLCEVEVGIAMFSPSEGGDPIVWPSLEEARKKLLEFWAVPEVERVKKMVTHERVLTDWVNDEMRKMQKRENEVERKEMNVVMNQELEKRKQDLLKLQQNPQPAPAADSGSWFIPAVAAPPALDGGGEGSHHGGSSSTNNGGGGNNYGHQLHGFDQVWPFNFPPSF
nr:agamous-like MADS-box protein AGL92 [Ipomoea trifida]GLL20483.1 agamous-like MADS-box protein AGL92 [Ipomoea trifida]